MAASPKLLRVSGFPFLLLALLFYTVVAGQGLLLALRLTICISGL